MVALTEEQAREILRRELDGNMWQLSELMGSMGTTRLARRDSMAVAVKLVNTPIEVMSRLSEIGVTPPILGAGELEGSRYLIQEVVTGPHPDHQWFEANLALWAEMIKAYILDEPLRLLLGELPGFWRLSVPDAVAMIDGQPEPRTGALREPDFVVALERWRRQSEAIPGLPMRPIHPDPHWHNYVIANDRPFLLDWEHLDLSDPIRDVGYQAWGFLPKKLWPEFLRRAGFTPTEELDLAIPWWAAFKLALNAFWNDRNADEGGARSHADMFRAAVDRQSWVREA